MSRNPAADSLGGPAGLVASEHHGHLAAAVRSLEVGAVLVYARPVIHQHEVQPLEVCLGVLACQRGARHVLHDLTVPSAVRGAGLLQRVIRLGQVPGVHGGVLLISPAGAEQPAHEQQGEDDGQNDQDGG